MLVPEGRGGSLAGAGVGGLAAPRTCRSRAVAARRPRITHATMAHAVCRGAIHQTCKLMMLPMDGP